MATLAPSVARTAPAVTLEPVACALCGTRSDEELYPPLSPSRDISPVFSASMGVRGTTRIVRCRDCGLCYVNPRFPDTHILHAYREAEDPYYTCQADARRRSFRRNARLVGRYASPGSLLDVGCAAGYFLDVAHDAGWTVAGVEPNRAFVELARERHPSVTLGTLVDLDCEDASFDVITMWDVLEHTVDPRAELSRAWRLLRPGGLLFVNFPNIASLSARATGSRWWFLLSHHLYYFTPATLSRLLTGEGFGVVARHPYVQTLELGYLAGMVRLYSDRQARRLERLMKAVGVAGIRLPYYAGQVTLVAAR